MPVRRQDAVTGKSITRLDGLNLKVRAPQQRRPSARSKPRSARWRCSATPDATQLRIAGRAYDLFNNRQPDGAAGAHRRAVGRRRPTPNTKSALRSARRARRSSPLNPQTQPDAGAHCVRSTRLPARGGYKALENRDRNQVAGKRNGGAAIRKRGRRRPRSSEHRPLRDAVEGLAQ